MRIISKQQDYYDSVQGLAFDDSLIYVRNMEGFDTDTYGKPENVKANNALTSLFKGVAYGFPGVPSEFEVGGQFKPKIEVMYVWFCGKAYVFYTDRSFHLKDINAKVATMKTPDEVKEYIADSYEGGANIVKKYEDRVLKHNRRYGKRSNDFLYGNGRSTNFDMTQYTKWEKAQSEKKLSTEPFIDFHTPIFAYQYVDIKDISNHKKGRYLYKDPILKNCGFQSIVDPFTAYQEIDMFLGNDLAGQHDPIMPVGGDLIVRDSKGFDEWSFKTVPGTKMRNGKVK